jgi:drug/metabolite transporter (DMT)-like permease
MLILKKDWRYPIQDFGWVMTRNIGGTVVIISLIYAMQYLPMGIYQIIYNTSPFWASLLAYITLGENLKQVEIMAMVLSFLLIMMLFISRQQSQGAPTLL